VWDVQPAKQLAVFRVPQQVRVQAVLSPDGKRLATWGLYAAVKPNDEEPGRSLQLWVVDGGKRLRRLVLDAAPRLVEVRSAVFSPDGKTLAVAGAKDSIHLFDVATGKAARRLEGPAGTGAALSYSADGKLLAAVTYAGDILRWETGTWRQLAAVKNAGVRPMGLGFAGRDKVLAFGMDGLAVGLWEAPTDKRPAALLGGHHDAVLATAFLPGGKALVSVSENGTVCQWDLATAKVSRHFILGAGSEQRPPYMIPFRGVERFEGDTEHLITPGIFGPQHPLGQTHVLAPRNRVEWKPAWARWSVALAPDGKRLAGQNLHGTGGIGIWDAPSGKALCVLQGSQWHLQWQVSFTADANKLAGIVPGHGIRVWDTTTGQQLKAISTPGAYQPPLNVVDVLALSGDGKLLASCMQGMNPASRQMITEAWLWDLAKGKVIGRFAQSSEMVQALALSRDARYLALSTHQQVSLWDTARGERLWQARPDRGGCVHLAFSGDGRTLAGSCFTAPLADSVTYLWESATGQVRAVLRGHAGTVTCLAFSPDGNALASGSVDTTLLPWDLGARRGADILRNPDAAWANLGSSNGHDSFQVVSALIADADRAIALLKERLRVVEVTDLATLPIRKVYPFLDDPKVAVREKATRELELRGKEWLPWLRVAALGADSVERRRRLERVVRRLEQEGPSVGELRALRAVEVLERIGRRDARELDGTGGRRSPCLFDGTGRAGAGTSGASPLTRWDARMMRVECTCTLVRGQQ
jgi:WD40 repeat protein